MVIFYNTARLKEAGLEPPKANWTRAEFLDYAKKLTVDADGDGTPERYGYSWDNGGMFTSAIPWIYANGGDVVSDDFCSPTVTDPKVEDALQFMHDMIYVDKVAPAPTALNDLFPLFESGDIAMFGAGRWPLVSILPTGFTDFDIVNWPGNPDQVTEFGIDGFPMLSTTQNPDAAWEFIKFMTNKTFQEQLLGTADKPVGNVPASMSVADEMAKLPPANSRLFYHVLDGKAKLVPAPPAFNQLENIFIRYTSSIFADESTVSDAMNSAQAELADVVKCGS
jgi:multiple sugar transport system substrate-binding protein